MIQVRNQSSLIPQPHVSWGKYNSGVPHDLTIQVSQIAKIDFKYTRRTEFILNDSQQF